MKDDNPKIVPLRPGPLSRGAVSRPVQKLQELAREHLAKGLREVFDQLDDTFFDMAELADNARQQTLYFDAMRLIRVQRKPIESRFFSNIDQKLIAISTPATQSVTPINRDNSTRGFQLIDEDDLEEIIALDTMVSRCLERSDSALEELNSRLRSLFPKKITAHNNPYGPEELCDIFNEATGALDIDIRSKLLLFKLFERTVLNSLNDLYRNANKLLKDLGIEAQVKKKAIIKKQEPIARKPVTENQGKLPRENSVPPKKDKPDRRQSTSDRHGRLVNRLHRLLNQVHRTTVQDMDCQEAELDDVLDQIADIKSGVSSSADSGIGVIHLVDMLENRLSSGQKPAKLNDYDHNVVQLVDDLLNYFDERSAIPAGISSGLQKLKLPLLQLALQDNTFFDKEKHPARRLLNEIAQLSVRFENDESSSKDPLYIEIKRLMEQMLEREELDATALTELFAEFLVKVDKYERRIQVIEKRVLEEIAAAEKVNQAHTRVATELSGLLEGKALPQALVELAESAWAKVLFLTCLKSGDTSEQWQRDIDTLAELVAIVESKNPSEDHFMTAIQQVRHRLTDTAFDSYQLGLLVGRLEQFCFNSSSILSGEPREADNRKEVQEKVVLVETFRADLPGQVSIQGSDVNSRDLKKLGTLKEGSWFDLLNESEHQKRCKLVGLAEQVGKYVFVNRLGNLEEAYNSGGMLQQIEEKRLRLLDNNRLFDKSLEKLIQEIRFGEKSTLH